MARSPKSIRFPIPPLPDTSEAGADIEEAKRLSEFDEFLADRIASRAIAYRVFDAKEAKDIKLKLLPAIRAHVDTALIECICSNEPCKNHELPIPKYPYYKKEDLVQRRVRKLVESIYPNAHKEFIRQKVTGCMITVQNAVNIAWKQRSEIG